MDNQNSSSVQVADEEDMLKRQHQGSTEQTKSKYPGYTKRLTPVIIVFVIFVGLVIVTGEFIESAHVVIDEYDVEHVHQQGPAVQGMSITWPLPDLIASSSDIIVGEVGDIELRDYPLRATRSEYTEEELQILGGDEFLDEIRIAYHRIHVTETLKGNLTGSFLLARDDVDYYESINLSKIERGQRVLLFVRKGLQNPEYQPPVDEYYTAFGDNGIFDYAENNRVFPRYPEAFTGLTPEEGFIWEGTIRPFFHLDKLTKAIEDHPCHLEENPCQKFPSYWEQDDGSNIPTEEP